MLFHGKFNFLTLTSLRIIIQRIMEIGGGEVGGLHSTKFNVATGICSGEK